MTVIGIGDDGEAITPRAIRHDTRERGIVSGAEQWTKLCRAIDIEQHQLMAVFGKLRVKRRYDGPRTHREIDQRLKGEDRRHLSQFAFAAIASDPRLQISGQTIGLTRAVNGKRIVFERIEL